jgi:hypothetical protein
MSIPKVIAAVTASSFLMLAPAMAQTNPPVDAQSKSKAESPIIPGAAKARKAANPPAGQRPAADPQSNKLDSPAVNGAGSGEQGSDATAPQEEPSNDYGSRQENDSGLTK